MSDPRGIAEGRRAPTRRDLEAGLAEAERALDASLEALRTHGRQSITWQLYGQDCQRVRQLKGWLANGNYVGPRQVRAILEEKKGEGSL